MNPKITLSGSKFEVRRRKDVPMRAKRPDAKSDAITGATIGQYVQKINHLPTYNLTGKHLANIRGMHADIRRLNPQ
jgi:hypothetical protein